ncbi:ABC transporter ATP-binding protein [Candidatus Poribacteria bacterium]|nr:ABC transporter ATP-binding protein [Candidatus Poribacteria bacterium]
MEGGLPDQIIEIEKLTKNFGAITAVNELGFSVARGETVGLLGPNGAGKTTTIQMLLGLTKPTSGDIRFFNLNLQDSRRKILQRINFASAYISLPSNLTVYENLNVFGKLYGIPTPRRKIGDLLDLLEIPQVINQVTGALSSGQLTRLNLCKAFLNDPEILLLDEPTASLDPDIAEKVRLTLQNVQQEHGVTMLYTSHNMREVELMCDRVIFLSRGNIVAEGTPQEIVDNCQSESLEEVFISLARNGELKDFSELE